MRTAFGLLFLVGVGAVLAGGCSHSEGKRSPVPTPRTKPVTSNPSDLWRPVISSACGERLPRPPRGGHGPRRFYLFFACNRKKGPIVEAAAARALARKDRSPAGALRILLQGPTRAERSAGFTSPFGPRTARLSVKLAVRPEQGLAVVDLDPSIMRMKFAFISVAETAEITSTVGQFPDVKRVRILIGGRPLCAALGEC